MPTRLVRLVFALALLATGALLTAQQPQVTNAQLSTQPGGDLTETIATLERSPGPLWIGYLFPTAQPVTTNTSAGVTYLEKKSAGSGYRGGDYTHTADHALLLLRIADGGVSAARLAPPSAQFDAGGLRFVFLTGVTPEQSIAALQIIPSTAHGAQRKDVVFFISLHQSAQAVPALAALAGSGHEPETREAAAFWLANQRGHDGFVAIRTLARQDPDPAFRRKLAFDLTLSQDPEALAELIRMARQDTAPEVRQQAQFWLAQQAGKQLGQQAETQIAAELRASADDGPDAQSRKQAVFSISRLPGGQATAQLTALARTSKYPEVRRQAVFWLGQSQDPAALDFLTALLQQPADQAH